MRKQEEKEKEIKMGNVISCTAIAGLVILELAAIWKGIDGVLFSVVIATIAGVAGLTLPTPKFLKD